MGFTGIIYRGNKIAFSRAFSIELNSPLRFTANSTDTLQGGVSLGLTFDTSDDIASAFGFANRIDVPKPSDTDEPCQIFVKGTFLMAAALKITGSTSKSISARLTVNFTDAIKKVKLNELDFATNYDLGADPYDTAKDTCINPLNRDFIIFPVYNQLFGDETRNDGLTAANWQNRYDTAIDSFTDNNAVTPFVRLDKILEKIFAYGGYTLNNKFQTTDELKRLTLYSNVDARVSGTINFPRYLNLKSHLPETVATEFVNHISRFFNTAPSINHFTKEASIVSFENITKAAASKDWTDKRYQIISTDFDSEDAKIKRIKYKDYLSVTGHSFRYEQKFWEQTTVTDTANALTLNATNPRGVYFEKATNGYWFHDPALTTTELTRQFRPLEYDNEGQEIETPIIAAMSEYIELNAALHVGNVPFMRVKQSTSVQKEAPPLCLMAYRGMYPSVTGPYNATDQAIYPTANSTPYQSNKTQAGTDTLNLSLYGAGGIGDTYLSAWYNMLSYSKTITAKALLSIEDIFNFDFSEKIIIKNNVYFVKQLRLNITPNGLAETDLILVTTY